MKIAIEGMDGVGKTTVAKQLAERNNFRYVGNAIHKLFGIEDRKSEIYKFFQAKEDEIFLLSQTYRSTRYKHYIICFARSKIKKNL